MAPLTKISEGEYRDRSGYFQVSKVRLVDHNGTTVKAYAIALTLRGESRTLVSPLSHADCPTTLREAREFCEEFWDFANWADVETSRLAGIARANDATLAADDRKREMFWRAFSRSWEVQTRSGRRAALTHEGNAYRAKDRMTNRWREIDAQAARRVMEGITV